MNVDFQLTVVPAGRSIADLTLKDGFHRHIGRREVDFDSESLRNHFDRLFDTRAWLARYCDGKDEQARQLAEIGAVIAEHIFGPELFAALWTPQSPRVLKILFAGAERAGDLAAALARMPWEIARPSPAARSLAERSLRLCIDDETDVGQPDEALPLALEGPLRVLIVFAAARASRPLAARRERRELARLFETKIYPERNVTVDFLTHGVTRERLVEQTQSRGGYHILHWSGHGHQNLLELVKEDGGLDRIEGGELLALLREAGGYLPRLAVLSACHSGARAPTDMESLLQRVRAGDPLEKETPQGPDTLAHKPGFTGTAQALRAGGVPSVLAMRFAVSDEYARDLAVAFYDALLADASPKNAAEALAQAQRELSRPWRDVYGPCDHATPVLLGVADPGLAPPAGENAEYDPAGNRRHGVDELDAARTHPHFVGRVWELAGLEREFFGISKDAAIKPVAVVAGIGGMGKTALAAEALDLWGARFRHVLIYQAKPNELKFEDWLIKIDQRLRDVSEAYAERMRKHPLEAIYRRPSEEFMGERRVARLVENLIAALRREAILIVLDNFETNLVEGAGASALSCKDAAFDNCLARLAEALIGSRSRVLITCRRPLAAIEKTAHLVRLGPLPPAEAVLFLGDHEQLRRLARGGEAERSLATRILNASRFHPLLMDRLARLAAPGLETQLEQALTTLEQREDFAALPELFAGKGGDAEEIAYLEDALALSIDRAIAEVGVDARRLLWIISLANEPVDFGLLAGVWSGESLETEQLRLLKATLADLETMTAEQQESARQLPQELVAKLDALPPPLVQLDPRPLLYVMEKIGLVDIASEGLDGENLDISCHELVRERILHWMSKNATDKCELNEAAVRLAYAERLIVHFLAMRMDNQALALNAGVKAFVYVTQARAYERLSKFASLVVIRSKDNNTRERLFPHLQTAANAELEGPARWSCLAYLADALRKAHRYDESLPLYEEAALSAQVAAADGGDTAFRAQGDLAWILGNWGIALRRAGDLVGARERLLQSSEALERSGRSFADVVGVELEILRIEIIQGHAESTLPQIDDLLRKIVAQWNASAKSPPTHDRDLLAHALIGALDIAADAFRALRRWKAALRYIEAIIDIKRQLARPKEDIALNRVSRADMLSELNRYSEAKAELEACLDLLNNDPYAKSAAIGALANIYNELGDRGEAIVQERRSLALADTLPVPRDRAASHHKLGNYLSSSGGKENFAEGARHSIAAVAYRLVADLRQDVQTNFRNYMRVFYKAASTGEDPAIPRLSALLDDPAFHALREWLAARQVDLDDLQSKIDQFLDAARQSAQQALSQEPPAP
jgi:hypothetical protein